MKVETARILLCALALAGGVACSSGDGEDITEATSNGSTGAGSCIETYSIEGLRARDFAFDGTVRSVEEAEGAERVTFDVHRWFKGGEDEETTLTASGFTGISSAGGGGRKTGDRLLVSGDGDFLWECGFTQDYDEAVASEWEDALGGS